MLKLGMPGLIIRLGASGSHSLVNEALQLAIKVLGSKSAGIQSAFLRELRTAEGMRFQRTLQNILRRFPEAAETAREILQERDNKGVGGVATTAAVASANAAS